MVGLDRGLDHWMACMHDGLDRPLMVVSNWHTERYNVPIPSIAGLH